MELPLSNDRRMKVDEFDSGKMLAHAAQQAKQRNYEQFPIVDVDSHHYELESFNEILEYMPDPVMKQLAQMANSGNSKGVGVMPGGVGYQDMGGRAIRYPLRRIEKPEPGVHRDMSLTRRWMDAMGVDFACCSPRRCCCSACIRRSRSKSRWPRLQPLALRARAGAGERASSRCSICRSTIPRRATGWSRSSPTRRACSASW